MKKNIRIFAAVLAAVALLSCLSGFSAAAVDRNYSDPLATARAELYGGDFLEKHFGFSLSDAEKNYLAIHDDFFLSYNSVIPSGYVTVKYDEAGKSLEVNAKDYSYLATNGVHVVWHPYSVRIEGCGEFFFSSPSLTVSLTDTAGEEVRVSYKAEFNVEKDVVNKLLNMAYNDAVRLKAEVEAEIAAYEAARLEYESDTKKYNEYIANLALYKEYLIAKRIYDESLAEYEEYVADLEAYTAAKAEYDAYVIERDKYNEAYAKYSEYLVYMEQYPAKLAAYEQYLKNVELVKKQLSIIDQTKDSITSLERSIYAAIMGDTVTSVIANKDIIASNLTGADPAAVDRAGIATTNLRTLLKTYFSFGTEKEKYTYYVTNYDSFRNNFAELLRSLDKLYLNKRIRGLMIAEGKQEKYVILVAQLYYVTVALWDTPVSNYDGNGYFDSSYMVGKSTSYYKDAAKPADILKTPAYMTDTNTATPISGGYPTPVEKPIYVTMDEPQKPTEVKKPIPPEREVQKPVEPAAVDEPTEAKKPGAAPIPYVVPREVSALIEAYDAGLVTQKAEVAEDVTFAPTVSVVRNYVSPKEVTVRFYGTSAVGETEKLLYEITVDSGSAIDYRGPAPVMAEERFYFYRHSGWVDSDGNRRDISTVNTDMELYAAFERVEKPYTVKWLVGDILLDSCPENPSLPDDGVSFYVFNQWEKTYRVDSETGEQTIDVIWVAHFTRHEYATAPSGILDLQVSEDKYVLSVRNGSSVNFATLLEKIAGEGELTVKTDKGIASFSFAETLALYNAGVVSVTMRAMQLSMGEYTYSVSLYDANGEQSAHVARMTFSAHCIAKTPTHLVVFYNDDGQRRPIKSTYDSDARQVSFSALTDNTYHAKVEYTLDAVSTSDVTVALDKNIAVEGERVKIQIDIPNGITVRGVYATDSDGNKVKIDPDDFRMLPYDVTISVDYVINEYTVIFVSDGKIIATFICRYGDTVIPPPDPEKASDHKYSYKFVGWSDEILPVTESVTYTAIYTYKLLPQKDTSGLQITPSVMKKIVLAASLGVTVAFILLPSAVITVIIFRKRKKLFLKTDKPKSKDKRCQI